MFDRYTEQARRAIFFARYEASIYGSPSIESEHLLLGLVRENRSALGVHFQQIGSVERLRREIAERNPPQGAVPTSLDLPLSDECRRILLLGAEEATILSHARIGIEDLMLGILREQNCLAAKLLGERGIDLDQARAALRTSESEGASVQGPVSGPGSGPGARRFRSSPAPVAPIHVVDAGSSQLLLTLPAGSALPRIGDGLTIRQREGSIESFSVREVVWDIQDAEIPVVAGVLLKVVRLAPGDPTS